MPGNDLVHTLGLDESPLAKGFDRAEARAKSFGQRVADMTPGVKGIQEGFQRIQSLVLGTTGALGAAAAGIGKLALGIIQFRNSGEMLDREMEKYKQIEISLGIQLTAHQQITRAIRERYEESLKGLDATPDDLGSLLSASVRGVADFVTGNDSDAAARELIESNRRQAEKTAAAAEKIRQDNEAEQLRRGLGRDVAGLAGTIGEDASAARFRVEAMEHEQRLARIRELDTVDKARLEELTRLEYERHWRVVQGLSIELADRQKSAAEARSREARTEQDRRVAAEETTARTLEDLRVGNLRAAGMQKEAELLQTQYAFARLRQDIERSGAGAESKAASLAELGVREREALALAGLDRGKSGTEYQRVAGTGIGAVATRQVLGSGSGAPGVRAVERTAKTTEQIRDAMKEIVIELRKQVGAVLS